MFLVGFPLLIIPFAIYNIVAFLMPGVSWFGALTSVHLASGADWTMSAGDILIAFAMLLLFAELVKARFVRRSVVDHALSLLVFLAMLVEFILVKQAASGTFFLLLVISLVDVLGGFAITLRTAQRDLTVEGSLPHISS